MPDPLTGRGLVTASSVSRYTTWRGLSRGSECASPNRLDGLSAQGLCWCALSCMPTLKQRIITLLGASSGLTDREITNHLLGASAGQQSVNAVARELANRGIVSRRARSDGKTGNYLASAVAPPPIIVSTIVTGTSTMSEDAAKRILQVWLAGTGWTSKIAWGRTKGIDIDAQKAGARWIIEVKGCGSRNAMRVNYFLAILGETLQRMSAPQARYSIALPDMKQYRALWARLPVLAKSRTQIDALFVDASGIVTPVP